jgi:hypothetical protein
MYTGQSALLSCQVTDQDADLKQVSYRIGDDEQTKQMQDKGGDNYEAKIIPSPDAIPGSYPVTIITQDNAGNSSEDKSLTIHILPPLGASGGPGYDDTRYPPENAFDDNNNTIWGGASGEGEWNLYYNLYRSLCRQMPSISG